MIGWRTFVSRLRADRRFRLLLIAGISGVVLLLLSGVRPVERAAKTENTFSAQRQAEAALETRLEKLLSSVAGVGRAEVMVTLDRLEETVYAADSETRDSGGSEKTVTVRDGSGENGLSETRILPVVRGVAVICRGASGAGIRREVTQLVCAALGVGANRVYVTTMEE